MKVSLNWLSDYVDIPVSAVELAKMLTNAGLEVDGEFTETDSDLVFDLDITSNRQDCLGHIGLAREIATILGCELKAPNPQPAETGKPVSEQVTVEVADAKLCPRYTARLVRGVKIGPSPAWLVERLEAVGLRSVNNVVDITNFVLMEYSQPLHAFDYDKLEGGKIIVRHAAKGEKITAIDGSSHELEDWMGVIADVSRPVAIAGVMGGLDTEVSDSTVNVLIESASFDPLTIRRGSRAMGLLSDSSYRFERGVDPVMLERASMRACEMILKMAGGELASGVVDVWDKPYEPAKVIMRPDRCNMLLGIEVPRDTQVQLLGTLGLGPQDKGDVIECSIPSHRANDLTREVDLIEEVGRTYGFDKLPIGNSVSHRVTNHSKSEIARKEVSTILTGSGYFEAITTSFIEDREAEIFGWGDSLFVDRRLRRSNGTLRQGILPSLLRCRKTNQDAGVNDVRFFEMAAVFPPDSSGTETLPREYVQLALLSDGGLRELRGALDAVVTRFDPALSMEAVPEDNEIFESGQSATLKLTGPNAPAEAFGAMGVVSKKICDFYGLTNAPAAAMVRFDLLASMGLAGRKYSPIAKFPASERDLSVVVESSALWQDMAACAQLSGGDLLRQCDFVGEYRGKQVGKNHKSVTMRLAFRHDSRTLTGEDVDESVSKVVDALAKQFGAELRT